MEVTRKGMDAVQRQEALLYHEVVLVEPVVRLPLKKLSGQETRKKANIINTERRGDLTNVSRTGKQSKTPLHPRSKANSCKRVT